MTNNLSFLNTQDLVGDFNSWRKDCNKSVNSSNTKWMIHVFCARWRSASRRPLIPTEKMHLSHSTFWHLKSREFSISLFWSERAWAYLCSHSAEYGSASLRERGRIIPRDPVRSRDSSVVCAGAQQSVNLLCGKHLFCWKAPYKKDVYSSAVDFFSLEIRG